MKIRAASTSDGPAIFELTRTAFGDYLTYTVYQSPKSVREVTKMLTPGELPDQELFVLEDANKVIGYYHAVVGYGEYHLNYIAIDSDRRSSGLGTALLRHFHNRALVHGSTRTSLDVFATNVRPHQWYLNEGYFEVGRNWLCRLELGGTRRDDASCLLFNLSDFRKALNEEATSGFSKIQCSFRGRPITLGLIAGHSCKLLSHDEPFDEFLLAAISTAFGSARRSLIVSLPAVVPLLPVMQSDVLIRMTKSVVKAARRVG